MSLFIYFNVNYLPNKTVAKLFFQVSHIVIGNLMSTGKNKQSAINVCIGNNLFS